MKLILQEQQKYLQSFINNATYHPMNPHCVKSLRIRSYSGPHFPELRLNMERYGVSVRIYSKCGKMREKFGPEKFQMQTLFTQCLMLMLHIRQSIYLVLTNVLSTSFLMFCIKFHEISTTLSGQFW